MGQIYVDVAAAQAEQGIALMASGGTIAGLWLSWDVNGYSGISWFWGKTPVTEWWNKNYSAYAYNESTEETFKQFMSSEKAPNDLNDALGGWGALEKTDFIYENGLNDTGCVSEASM